MSFSKVDKGYRRKEVINQQEVTSEQKCNQRSPGCYSSLFIPTKNPSPSTLIPLSKSTRNSLHQPLNYFLDISQSHYYVPPDAPCWGRYKALSDQDTRVSQILGLGVGGRPDLTLEDVKRTRPELQLTPVKEDDDEAESALAFPSHLVPQSPYDWKLPFNGYYPITKSRPDVECKAEVSLPHSSASTSSLSSSSSLLSSPSSASSSNQDKGNVAGSGEKTKKRRRQDTLLPKDSPFTVEQVVERPIDEFNQLLNDNNMDDEKQHYYKELRRKGKNREAAFKSRQNRMNRIKELTVEREKLQEEVSELKKTFSLRKQQLQEQSALKCPASIQRLEAKYCTTFAQNGVTMDELGLIIPVPPP